MKGERVDAYHRLARSLFEEVTVGAQKDADPKLRDYYARLALWCDARKAPEGGDQDGSSTGTPE